MHGSEFPGRWHQWVHAPKLGPMRVGLRHRCLDRVPESHPVAATYRIGTSCPDYQQAVSASPKNFCEYRRGNPVKSRTIRCRLERKTTELFFEMVFVNGKRERANHNVSAENFGMLKKGNPFMLVFGESRFFLFVYWNCFGCLDCPAKNCLVHLP